MLSTKPVEYVLMASDHGFAWIHFLSIKILVPRVVCFFGQMEKKTFHFYGGRGFQKLLWVIWSKVVQSFHQLVAFQQCMGVLEILMEKILRSAAISSSSGSRNDELW